MRRTIRTVALSMLVAALTLSAVAIMPMPGWSQDGGAITLYTDPGTGQVFTKRCKRCIRLGQYVPTGSTQEIERRVERKTQQQLDEERAAMQAEEAQRQAQQQQWNAEMAAAGVGDTAVRDGVRRPLVQEDIIRHSDLWRLPVLQSHWFRPAVPDSGDLAWTRQQQLQLIRHYPSLSGFQIHTRGRSFGARDAQHLRDN